MNLDIKNPALLYHFFFALAHILSWIILIWYGIRHKYPIIHWLLIIVTGYISFTIGSHLLAFDADSLKLLIKSGVWPISQGTSLVSGLLLAVPSMLLMKHLLSFKNHVFEPYAFTIPLGIAIQRFGCLAAGCCYGKPTDFTFGISYDFGHRIHFQQWENGAITDIHQTSIALHPVQLYESIMCIAALLFIYTIYKKGWMKGRLVYVFLWLYTIIRFITEIFRAAEAHTIGLSSYLGLNTVQWIMIFAFFIFLYVITKGQHIIEIEESRPLRPRTYFVKEYLWYILLLGLILLTPGFYSRLERLLLGVLFIPLSGVVFWNLFKSITIPQLRTATVSFCAISVFIMSQSNPIDNDKELPVKYHEISIGGNLGSLNMDHYTVGCDGTRNYDYRFIENYYLIGAGYRYVHQYDENEKLTVGFSASYGKLKEHVENSNKPNGNWSDIDYTYHQNMYSISPYLQYDRRKIGFGLGLNAGDISVFRPDNPPFTIFQRYSLLPLIHFRVGNLEKFWTEFNYGYRFPGIAPTNEYEILLGSRGQKGNLVRFGTSAYHAIVVRPEFYIDNKITIQPYVGIFGPLFSSSYSDRMGFQGGINLHYRIYK